jgi:flagellar hook assembly protein FlgD/outer membrane protein OmpA-like peptidoglycan-associated protein
MVYTFTRITALGFLLIALSAVSALAAGQRNAEAPDIENLQSEPQYISPQSSSGVQDTLTAEPAIQTAEKLVVRGFRFTVRDSGGNVVYTREEELERPGFFTRAFTFVFWQRKDQLSVPEALTWDGTNNEGEPVPEGEYTYTLAAWDDQQNRTTSSPVPVIVDNTPPEAQVSTPYRIFSPNNDGNKDILVLEQQGSVEPEWTGTFTNADGETVREFTWSEQEPENFAWQGRNDADEVVPDGSYTYELAATDRAGNSFSTEVSNIEIDTKDTPIGVTINRSYFSPDGNDQGDTIEFTPDVPVREGIVNWSVRVLDSNDNEAFSFQSEADIPERYSFDGQPPDGDTLEEGTYRAVFSVLYENGNNPTATSPEFTLDLTAPEASVSADLDVFSPNDDGNKERITFLQSTSDEVRWNARITDAEGDVIRRFEWTDDVPATVTWNGINQQGEEVPNGEYRYTLFTTDRAENYGEAQTELFRKDARRTPIRLSAGTGAFSPNGDGSKDTVTFNPEIEDPEGLQQVRYEVRSRGGALVRSEVVNSEPFSFTWNGRDNRTQLVDDGQYSISLRGTYRNGNQPTAQAGPITVDTEFPQASVSVPYKLFSPDGDGNLDTLQFSQDDASTEDRWVGRILDSDGSVVERYTWRGTPEDFTWRGRDDAGNRVDDGTYRYVLESEDAAGNRSTFRVSNIRIDTRPTPVSVSISRRAFSPNADGVADTLEIQIEPEVTESIVSWQLNIVGSDGAMHRRYSGGSNIPETVSFSGREDTGRKAPEGVYRARATVRYENGNEPQAESAPFRLDVSAPQARVSTDQDLFSPNGDGRKEQVTISQSGSGAEEWTGEVRGPEGETVREFNWSGSPASTVTWDGTTATGSEVPDGQYQYVLVGRDAAGNTTTTSPVSFEKDTRRRRISLSIPRTHFSPNGDGTQESVTVEAGVSPTRDVRVVNHRFRITDGEGNTVYQASGDGGLRSTYSWDGTRTGGQQAADGEYTARLRAEFANGDVVEQQSNTIVLDTQPPSISMRTEHTLFSPNGDGRKDSILIEQDSSSEQQWTGRILDSDGNVVVTERWSGEAEDFRWDGTDEFGNTVEDGEYRYTVSSTDQAGNSASATLGPLEVDNTATSAFVSFSRSRFSPEERGDTVRINLYANPNRDIAEWTLRILDEDGNRVAHFGSNQSATVPRSIAWNGRGGDRGSGGESDRTGSLVSDGRYTAELEARYIKGDLVESESSSSLVLDTEGPEFSVEAGPRPFSPDNDGTADTLRIEITDRQELTSVRSWEIDILDPRGSSFHTLSGRGDPPREITWNGRSASGELVQAASDYTLETTLTDTLGNSRTKRTTVPIDVLVIDEGDQLKIRISSINFAPNTAEFTGISDEQDEQNRQTLDRLAEILQRYSNYRIRVEGHANNVTGTQREEREELQPLSKNRAERVKEALVERGIEAARMETVGEGGTEPIVSRENRDEWWKNRRVEFILIEESRQ